MKVGEARKAAAKWVSQHASREAGFLGAYFSGSTVGLPEEAELPESSDIDLIIVTRLAEPPAKRGNFRFEQALLEATSLSWNQLASAESILSDYHLAGSFRTDTRSSPIRRVSCADCRPKWPPALPNGLGSCGAASMHWTGSNSVCAVSVPMRRGQIRSWDGCSRPGLRPMSC